MSNSTETQEDIDREVVESDVTFVGAGPACLAGAIHLHNLIEAHNEQADLNPDIEPINPKIVILEKGAEVGSHGISKPSWIRLHSQN